MARLATTPLMKANSLIPTIFPLFRASFPAETSSIAALLLSFVLQNLTVVQLPESWVKEYKRI